MRIGYVIKYFYPIAGGAENYFLNLALKAAADGHEVHVFTGNRKGNEKLEKFEEEYKRIKIHRSRFWFDLSHYLYFNPSLLFKVAKADLDIIHASSFGHIWQDFVLILKRLISPKTKFISTPHGPFMTLGRYNFLLRIIRGIYTFIQKIFLNWLYDVVLEDNTFQWQWILSYGIKKEKIAFVPVGIAEEIVNKTIAQSDVEDFKRKYDLSNKFVICSLSRISEYKGFQHVIEILPELNKIKKNLVFLVMGRDEGYAQSLKSQAERLKVKSNVRFILDVSEEEKYIGLEVSDIFIFSSQWEAFGIVLLEAMSRGNALVSTKTEGGKFLIAEGINGYLYDFGDTKKLDEILQKLIMDKELVQKMREENFRRVKGFSWERIYLKYYLPLLS